MRIIRVAAAQFGAIQPAEPRSSVVDRMITLLDQAGRAGAHFVIYPELALTTFFPRYYHQDPAAADPWFERAMPNEATRPLFERAVSHRLALSFGYAELTPDGQHFNTSILVDASGAVVAKYRKIHLPGHADYDPERSHQHLEKRYFRPGDLGFPVWDFLGGRIGMCICNDRRWPETYRVMGLQGVEMIVLGFNTPSENPQHRDEGKALRLFHHRICLQAGAYQNSTWVVAVAKAGIEDGHHLMGGTCIIDPQGTIVGEIPHEQDGILVHDCDLDATAFGKATILDFAAHRRIEHYGLITSRTGVEP